MKVSSGKSKLSLVAGFSTIILILLSVSGISLQRLSEISTRFEDVVTQQNVRGQLAQEMFQASRERTFMLHAMAITDDPFDRDDIYLAFLAEGEKFLGARERLIEMGLNAEENAILDRQRAAAQKAVPLQYQAIDMLNEDRVEEANALLLDVAIPAQNITLSAIIDFMELQRHQSQTSLETTRKTFETTYGMVLALGVIGVLASISIAIFVMFKIGHFIDALRSANEELERRVDERTVALSEANEKLQKLASYDIVTGLPNRIVFMEYLDRAIAHGERNSKLVALLFLDLDGFKAVNDERGHDMGDKVLKEVGRRLRGCVRGEDLVARIGGDEFVVVLGNLSTRDHAETVASKIIEVVSNPCQFADIQCDVGVSIGISVYPDHGIEVSSLVTRADEAMYRVKRDGKNSFQFS